MEDFADWAAAGCVGWSPEDVLPYFARLEDDAEFGGEPYHGRGGPTPIFRMPQDQWGGADAALSAAAQAAGHAWAPDVNAPGAAGVSPYPINSRDGRRVTVNDGYLEPARSLPGLTVRGDALVDRVVFDGDRAVGVRVIAAGTAVTEYADEIVLERRDPLAGDPVAVGHRPGRGPAPPRYRGAGRPPRRPGHAGPSDDRRRAAADRGGRDQDGRRPPHQRLRPLRSGSGPAHDMMFVSLNMNVLSMENADTRVPMGGFGVWLNQNFCAGC